MGLLRPMVITCGWLARCWRPCGWEQDSGAAFAVVMQTLLTLAAALLFHRLLRMMGLEHGVLGLAVVAGYLLGTTVYGSSASQCVDVDCGNDLALAPICADRRSLWFTTGAIFGMASPG